MPVCRARSVRNDAPRLRSDSSTASAIGSSAGASARRRRGSWRSVSRRKKASGAVALTQPHVRFAAGGPFVQPARLIARHARRQHRLLPQLRRQRQALQALQDLGQARRLAAARRRDGRPASAAGNRRTAAAHRSTTSRRRIARLPRCTCSRFVRRRPLQRLRLVRAGTGTSRPAARTTPPAAAAPTLPRTDSGPARRPDPTRACVSGSATGSPVAGGRAAAPASAARPGRTPVDNSASSSASDPAARLAARAAVRSAAPGRRPPVPARNAAIGPSSSDGVRSPRRRSHSAISVAERGGWPRPRNRRSTWWTARGSSRCACRSGATSCSSNCCIQRPRPRPARRRSGRTDT